MEVQVKRDNICINKLVCEKKEIIFIEEDIIVPDTKPDILSAINISGNVCINQKEVQDEKVKLEGNVFTYIMYLPDSKEDNLRGLQASLEFSKNINISGCKEGMNLTCNSQIKDMECKVLNGRKIKIKVGVELTIKIFSNENVEFINSVENVENIQTLNKNFKINSLVGKGSTKVYVKETLNIGQGDEIAEILKTEINLVDKDVKISYNKVLTKTEANVKIMYLTEDNRINTTEGNIPVVGFIDMPDVSEDNICDTTYELKTMLIRPNPSEEHTIYVEFEYEVMCMTYEKKELILIQDLYSPTESLNFSQKSISTTIEKKNISKNFTLTSKIKIDEINDGELLDVELNPILNNQKFENSKITYNGEININFIFYTGENKRINSKVSKLPFDFNTNCEEISQFDGMNTNLNIINKKFEKKSDGNIECNIEIEFITEISRNASINIIENVVLDETRKKTEEYDSLILYIVQKGDTLWNIAKKFNSTIEEIAISNGIEDADKIYVNQKLYIPKFKYMTKKENINENII